MFSLLQQNKRGKGQPKGHTVKQKEIGLNGFKNPKLLQLAYNSKIKKWFLGKDKTQGPPRK